ncbi:MAG: hypothetical protein IPO60_07975 [Flavobacteriales bacterium]|nr:hypothetical protein [Flavobacteriales bacterium]
MSVNRRNLLYWTTQLVAWTGYMLLLGLPAWMEGSFSATFGLVTFGHGRHRYRQQPARACSSRNGTGWTCPWAGSSCAW